MTPEQMRRAAELLEDNARFFREYGERAASDERCDLARLLREQADAINPTRPRRPVETCPACGGTGWQD